MLLQGANSDLNTSTVSAPLSRSHSVSISFCVCVCSVKKCVCRLVTQPV